MNRHLLSFYRTVALVLFLGSSSMSFSQDFADNISNVSETDNQLNAIDADLNTFATVRANSGLALGLGAYSGHIELEYPTELVANTTSYIKIETEDDILSSLLGGSLGSLLSNITGIALIGNQELLVSAKNDNVLIDEWNSAQAGDFGNEAAKIVIDRSGDYFAAITPNNAYNRIRLENRVGSLIGLSQERGLNVFSSFHFDNRQSCGVPSYTSFDGNGLTLDLLNLGGAGVNNPENAIDGDLSTFSNIGLGVINVFAALEQTFFFEESDMPGDHYYIKLAMDPSLLEVGLANNIEIVGRQGAQNPTFVQSLSSLLSLEVVGLLQNNQPAIVAFSTDTPIDRLTLRVSSLLGVDIGQELEVYEVFRAPAMPVINEGEADHYICQNETATLNATVEGNAGAEVRWYDAMEGGNLVATTNTTTDFVTPNLANSTTYYAASSYTGCSEESPRTPINIEVRQTPTQSDISVSGDENPVCSSNSVVLTPSSNVAGTFRWYFDGNMNAEITDGMVNGSSTFNIDENGRLIVSGLNQGGSPFNYYVAVTDSLAGCTNTAGDLAHAQVEVVDFDKDITVSANIGKTIDDLISIFAGNTTETVNGTLTGDFVVGEEVILAINGTEYAGNVQSDASFSIAVDAIDLVSDLDQIIDVRLNNGICIANDEIAIGLPDLFVDATTQVFCGTDVSTVADLDLGNQNLVVFDDLYAGLQLDANTPLIDGEVYFAGLLNVPSSVLSRVAVTVQIDYVATPSTNANHQVYCDSELATVADLQVNETNIVFYDSASGGNIMDPDTILIDGGRYYAAQVQGNCESNRLRITVGLTADEHPAIVINGEIEDACINRSYTYTTHSNKTSYDWNVSGALLPKEVPLPMIM